MAVYSISDLAKLSGVKAPTIRAWEQRYALLEPKRTATNIRYYDDGDLKALLNIALLNKHGIKISKIARLSQAERRDKIANLGAAPHAFDAQLDTLTLSMIELDEFKFSHILDANIHQLGFEKTMMEVIYPFLDKLGVLWLTGSVSAVHESFVSNIIRAKLIAATNCIPIRHNNQQTRYLLFLPEGEQQELSLLFMHYLLRTRGCATLYLGQDISISDLRDAQPLFKPDYLFTIISETFVAHSVSQYIHNILDHIPEPTLLVTGYQVAVQDIKPHARLHCLRSLGDTLALVEQGTPESQKVATI